MTSRVSPREKVLPGATQRRTVPPITRRAALRAAATLAPTVAPSVPEWPATTETRVATRNLGLGAGLFGLLSADDLDPARVYATFDDVRASGVSTRMRTIAAEIDRERPAIVGLQEAASIRRGPSNEEATAGVVDFLDELQQALVARGTPYRVAASVTNADVSLPADPPDGAPFTVRLVDRDVLLVRPDVPVVGTSAATYDVNASRTVGGRRLTATRGYCLADVLLDGVAVTGVATHLAASSGFVRRAQVGELLAALDGRDDATVLLGDLNSAPADGGGSAYHSLATEFTDAWSVADGAGPTCCQIPTLTNDGSRLDRRVDVVFVRGPIDPLAVRRTGEAVDARVTVGDRTLWPSDHAGVVADLRVAPSLADPRGVVRALL